MGVVVRFPRHAPASSTTGLKKASIGTVPPEISLKRLARPRDASLRRAKMLRKCATEQSADSASCRTVIPFNSAQRRMGCCSDMAEDISPRNDKSQPEIFLPEIALPVKGLLECDMAKRKTTEPRKLFLAEWLKHWDIGPTEAAKIAGCKQSYISNIASGARGNPNVFILLALSEHYDIFINDLFQRPPSRAEAQASIIARSQKKA
jgi:transcriptional regulator with XRE-family HTH domain